MLRDRRFGIGARLHALKMKVAARAANINVRRQGNIIQANKLIIHFAAEGHPVDVGSTV